MTATHEVTNQPPPLEGYDVFGGDAALVEAVEREGAGWALDDLHALGRLAGSPEAIEWGAQANRYPPELRTHDRFGHRIDEVAYHPAYHELMRVAVAHGLHGAPWAVEQPGAHVARAAGFVTWSQVDAGHGCPISMTYSIVPALRAQPDLAREWEPRLVARAYDPRNVPATEKAGATAGMGMTEKQGGSDVRANTTVAEPAGDGTWRLTGHKWFCSAPMSDVFLMLAQAPGGLSCFLVPRWLPDGERNAGFQLQRLKDKLGNRSNASSEAEFHGALGYLVGEPGAGIRTIMDMVTLTRLDCAVASAGLMRAALAEAVHHTRHRKVFGKALVEQPLMGRVLADLALDVAAATALAFRLARAFDVAAADRAEAAYARVMTPVTKYWVCKIAPAIIYEAMECLGGNGYVEDWPLARYYREAPVNAIWEGSGNVMALDVLRVLSRNGALFEAVLEGIGGDLGKSGGRTVEVLRAAMRVCESDEGAARILVEQLALAAAAAELRRLGAGRVADAFIETRLAGQWRATYGMLDARHDATAIIDVLYPEAL